MSLQTFACNGANIKNILGILKQHRWDCFRIKDTDSIKELGLNRIFFFDLAQVIYLKK